MRLYRLLPWLHISRLFGQIADAHLPPPLAALLVNIHVNFGYWNLIPNTCFKFINSNNKDIFALGREDIIFCTHCSEVYEGWSQLFANHDLAKLKAADKVKNQSLWKREAIKNI